MTAREPDAMTIDLLAAGYGCDRNTAEIMAILHSLSPAKREAAIQEIRRMVAEFQKKREAES